jgi:predicted metal-dependent phosphoesterase TrpH
MEGRADLHIHTTHSDGALTARAIVGHARRSGLTTISITDHDSTGAIDEAIAAGRDCGVAVIPGVELSTSLDGQDVHLLGYFIDHTHSGVQAHLEVLRRERLRRAERIVGRLNALNVPLPFEAVLDQAGHGSIGRPHIAHAMVELGLTQSYHEAFLKYIGAGRPAYEQHAKMTPSEAVVLIAAAGGLSFIAHPGASLTDDMLRTLIADGVDGIETVHPCHSPEQ